MHIVHFCGALKGGPLTAIAEWTKQQIANGNRISLIYSPLRDPVESFRADIAPQIELIPLPVMRDIHLKSDFGACIALVAMLRKMQPDIIHLHSSKAGAIGRIAARLTGVPAIYSTHGLAYLRTDVGFAVRALFFSLEWLLGLVGTITVACSPSELRCMRLIPGEKMNIPNGIDLTSLPAQASDQPHDGLEIVLCGRITAQKNPELACQIAALSPPEWRWTWLGDGEQEELVRKSGRIAVAGWMPRPKAMARLRSSDIMVHTSRWEGMPIAILEAMAFGVPVVATNVVGNRDLILQGETGFVASDLPSFLAALMQLADSKDLRRRMGEASQRRIADEYDQAKLASRWTALYARVGQAE